MVEDPHSSHSDSVDASSGLLYGGGLLIAAVVVMRAMLTGFAEPSVANPMIVSLVVLLAAVVAVRTLVAKSVVLPDMWVLLPLIALVAVGAVSVGIASHTWPAATQFINWATNALFFLAVYALAADSAERGQATRRAVVAGVLATVAVIALYGIYQRFAVMPGLLATMKGDPEGRELLKIPGAIGRVLSGEVYGTFVTSNAFAGYLALVLPAAVGMALWGFTAKQKPAAVAGAAVAVALCVTLVFTGSPGGWVSAAAGLGVLGCILWGRRGFELLSSRLPSRRASVIVLAAAGTVIALIVAVALLSTDSMQVRLQYWAAALRMYPDNPMGVGLGNFTDHYTTYKTPAGLETREVHNVYLNLLTEAGPLALLAFGALLYGVARSLKSSPLALGPTPAKWDEPDDAVAGRVGLLALAGGLSAMFAAYAIGAVTPSGMHSQKIIEFITDTVGPGTTAAALTHIAFVPLWGALFILFYKRGIDSSQVRAGLVAGLAALLVHGLVEFDFRIKTTMLTACVLGATALAGSPRAMALGGVKRFIPLVVALAAIVPLLLFGSRLQMKRWEQATLADGELSRAERLENAASELSALVTARNYHEIEPILMSLGEPELRASAANIRDSISMGQYTRLRREVSAFGAEARREARSSLRSAWENLAEYVAEVPGDGQRVMLLARLARMIKVRGIDIKTDDTVERAIRLLTVRAPASFNSWMELGHFHARKGHLTQAAAAFTKAADLYPLNPRIWLRLGDAAVFFDPDRALEAYGEAMEANALTEDENTSLFAWLWEAPPSRPTSGDLAANIDEQEESVPILFRRGLLFWQIGGFEQAAAQFEKALKLSPADPQLSAFRALLLEMSSVAGTGDADAAELLNAWNEFRRIQGSAPSERRIPRRMVELFESRRPALHAMVGGRTR